MTEHHEHHHAAAVAEPEPVAAPDPIDGVTIKPENVERRVYAVLDEAGDFVKYEQVAVADFDAWEKKELKKKDGTVEYPNKNKQLMIKQSFREYTVGSVHGLTALIGDDEEAVNIVNRGLAQKTSQKVNFALLEVDEKNNLVFQQSDEAVDTRDMLQEATKRKSLSPIDKAVKGIKAAGFDFDADQIRALLAQLQQSKAEAGA